MPLTGKGEKILRAMTKSYGAEKAEHVLYASKNAGTITGIDDDAIPAGLEQIADAMSECADAIEGLHRRVDAYCARAATDDHRVLGGVQLDAAPTDDHLRKAGARLARTGGDDWTEARARSWGAEGRTGTEAKRAGDLVAEGFAAERRKMGESGGAARTGKRLDAGDSDMKKGALFWLKKTKPLPSGKQVRLRVSLLWEEKGGKWLGRIVTPGLYSGGNEIVGPEDLE